jgi:hypothetical protein
VVGLSAQSKDRVLESGERCLERRKQLSSCGPRPTHSRARCNVERLCVAELGANLLQQLFGSCVREPVLNRELTPMQSSANVARCADTVEQAVSHRML